MIENRLILKANTIKTLNGNIHLTGSKSECNRALILESVSGGLVKVENLSEAADTQTLASLIRNEVSTPASGIPILDVGPAGTAMRFLTASLCLGTESVILTGSERMKQRPIGILVSALQAIGAEIEYLEKDGFPPLKIAANLRQTSPEVSIPGNISSQFISALLLIAPALPLGLNLKIEGELTSAPYVEMTLSMLAEAGISHSWTDNQISIARQSFREIILSPEPDWSAASYWFSVAALSEKASFFLPGLKKNSKQGDSIITEIMAQLGVKSWFEEGGLRIEKDKFEIPAELNYNFKSCPDLAQTVIACLAGLHIPGKFKGLETLKIKETDRVNALGNELAKIGAKFGELTSGEWELTFNSTAIPHSVTFNTYDDHRMAMALAPLALKIEEVVIENPEVVSKSYPKFWQHLEMVIDAHINPQV